MSIMYVFDSAKDYRALKPKPTQNLVQQSSTENQASAKKCLFGVADPDDTEKLLEQQREADRERFLERFGFDIEDIENMENRMNHQNSRPGRTRRMITSIQENYHNKTIAKKRRKLIFKTVDKKITDFYQVRKNVLETKDKDF